MFEQLEARGRRIAEDARRRTLDRLGTAARNAFPDLRVEADDRAVTLSGRRLIRRMLGDARLRWIAGLIR